MIDDNVYNILISNVNQGMQSYYKNQCKSLEKLRNRIIKIHRTICLLPYYMFVIESKKRQRQVQYFLPAMSDIDLISTLIRPKEIKAFPVLSMMAQESSFLINYLINNPNDFAREIINSKNNIENLDYYHLMFQIIPSIFGFFHSFEHLSAASNFYQVVIDLMYDNPKNSIRILQPFLNSPATYRYIEYVMTKFFKKLILSKLYNNFYEINFNDKNSPSYKEYILHQNKHTKKLLYYLTKGASLLPDQILQIFRQIRVKYADKWDVKLWYKLVFVIFINPHANRWARSHFFNKDENPIYSFQNLFKKNSDTKLRISSLPKSPMSLLPKSPISSFPNSFFSPTYKFDKLMTNKLNKLNLINDILSNVLNDLFKRDFDLFIDTLCTVQSSYSPPKMYNFYGNFSIQYFMMTNDLIVLVNFMVERNIVPSFIKTNLFQGISDEYITGNFYLTIYQNPPTEKVIKIEHPIVFSHISIDPEVIKKFNQQIEYRSRLASLESLAYNKDVNGNLFALEKSAKDPDFHQYVQTHVTIQLADSAESFEEFIECQRLLDEVEKWDILTSSYSNLLFLAYLLHFQKMPSLFEFLPNKVKLLNQLDIVDEKEFQDKFEKVLVFADDWDSYINTLEIDKSKSGNFFSGCYENFPVIFEPYSEVDPTGLKYLEFIDQLDYINKSSQLPLYFLKAFSTFSMIPLVSLPEKYELFMDFLEIIDLFFPKENNSLFLLLIKKISGSLLMKLFIEISTVAIHNDRCFSCISVREMTKWQRFENLIYETVSDNNEIFQKILKCQMFFHDFFDSWKKEISGSKNKQLKRNKSILINIE